MEVQSACREETTISADRKKAKRGGTVNRIIILELLSSKRERKSQKELDIRPVFLTMYVKI